MPDIREKVEDDRGLIKKIQLKIPGYAGYRRREDIRNADILLRNQVADQVKKVRSDLEGVRDDLAAARRLVRSLRAAEEEETGDHRAHLAFVPVIITMRWAKVASNALSVSPKALRAWLRLAASAAFPIVGMSAASWSSPVSML